MAKSDAVFLEGSLLRHIIIMSGTATIGLVAIFLVDLVDMLFISMLGNDALAAAVGYSGAILFFTTSLVIGMAITAGALVSRDLGAGETEKAREQMTHVLIIGLAMSFVLVAVVWLNLETLTGWIGATGETQRLAIRYLSIIIPSMPLMMIGMTCSGVLRAHGLAKISTTVTLVAGGVNAVLDPIFIFGFGLGLDGAAIATVLARLAMAAAAVYPIVTRLGGFSSPRMSALIPDFKPVMAIAIPTILANLATPIGGAYVTRMMAEFGEEAVAGMAIVGRVTPVAFAMMFALSGAIGPIIGQNFGAQKFDRVRQAFMESVIFIVIYVVGVVGILFLLRGSIANLFGAMGVARDLIFLFCGPLSLLWIFNGVIFVGNAAYNNLGHPFYSTWINWGRNTLGIVPFVYFGAQWWGAQGVLIGQMAGGVFIALVSWWLSQRMMNKMVAGQVEVSQDPAVTALKKQHQLFNHRR
jgi:putative MATE family efflux protein